MKRRVGFLIAVLILLLLAGCTALPTPSDIAATFRIGTPSATPEFTTRATVTPSTTTTETATASPYTTITLTETNIVTPTQTETATAIPTSTATPTSIPSPIPPFLPTEIVTLPYIAICPDATNTEAFSIDMQGFRHNLSQGFTEAEFFRLQKAFTDYLNAGGSPQTIAEFFNEIQVEGSSEPKRVAWVDIQQIDLDDDGVTEIMLTFFTNYIGLNNSAVFFFACNTQTQYEFVGRLWGNESYMYGPEIITIEDLNQDGYKEVVVEALWATSSSEQYLQVVGLVQGALVTYLDINDPYGGLGISSSKITVEDVNGDGLKDIVLEGEDSDHLGAIYTYRTIKATYLASPSGYYFPPIIEYPYSHKRIHILQDAQRALQIGNWTEAQRLYEVAIYDESLSTAPTAAPPEWDEYEISFAYFRLITLLYAINDIDNTMPLEQEYNTRFKDEEAGSEFRSLLVTFTETWEKTNNVVLACGQVNLLYDTVVSRQKSVYEVATLGRGGVGMDYAFCPFITAEGMKAYRGIINDFVVFP